MRDCPAVLGYAMRSRSSARSMRRFVSPGRLAPAAGALLGVVALAAPAAPAQRPPAVAHTSIIGGRAAQAGSFPSLAYVIDIQGRYAYQCTGTVVAPSLVLTAGHCAEDTSTGARY